MVNSMRSIDTVNAMVRHAVRVSRLASELGAGSRLIVPWAIARAPAFRASQSGNTPTTGARPNPTVRGANCLSQRRLAPQLRLSLLLYSVVAPDDAQLALNRSGLTNVRTR